MSRFVPIADSPPMDEVHSLEQMTGRFQSLRDGLPELVKNSKDQYARLGITDRAERQIIVIVSSRAKGCAGDRERAAVPAGGTRPMTLAGQRKRVRPAMHIRGAWERARS